MISIDLPRGLEQHLWDVVRDDYDGDLQVAMAAFLKLRVVIMFGGHDAK